MLIALVATAIYSLGIVFNVSPWLRGPKEWRWPYVIPGTIERLWLSVVLLAGYVLFIWWWEKRPFRKRHTLVALLFAGLMTVLLQFSLLYLDHADIIEPLFMRTVSMESGGFFNVGATVTNNADFLANFVERMPGYPIHPQRHPPGLDMLFAMSRQQFDRYPSLAAAVADRLRPYQCHNLALMNLPNSALATAVTQMLVPLFLALVVWPLYHFGCQNYDKQSGLRAALLWPLIPSVALWATRWNQLYAVFTLLAFIFLYLGLSRQRLWPIFVSGLVVSLGSFFSLGNVTIVVFLALYALLFLVAAEIRPSLRWLILSGIAFLIGFALFWIAMWLIYDLNFFGVWNTAMGTHLSLGRSYLTWLFYHPYDFFVFLGIPLFVFWLARTVTAVGDLRQRRIEALTLSFGLGLLLLILSGTSQGEVARVWAFLMPLALLIAVSLIGDQIGALTALAALLSLQILISNIFLQPVGTGLLDSPKSPALASETGEVLAIWNDGPFLSRLELPETAVAGQTITLDATWNSQEQSERPYTLFLHLLDNQGKLVAQFDGMPLDNIWPTTCWQKNQPFDDSYQLIIPAGTAPGIYTVTTGFYWLPTGERLPLQLPNGRAENNIEIGRIRIQE